MKFNSINTKVVFLIFASLILLSCGKSKDKKETYTAVNEVKQTFVGGNTCISCHETEYELWKDSHHDQAMKIADSTSILANFNNSSFTHKGVTSKFYKKEGDF